MAIKLSQAVGAVLMLVGLSSCGSSAPKPLYNWHNYASTSYEYARTSSEKSVAELSKTYARLIDKQGKGLRKTPPPGMCAEYGYLLIKQGQTAKGLELLKREIALYPESATFINRLIKQYE